MPFANNKGVRIYYEVEGEGPPLVLAHGTSSALDAWRRYGYSVALRNDYKLVLFDARGHGRSDKPHETSAYEIKLRVADVVAVLDDLGISKAHYLGYSMGARIGLRVATQSVSRFHSFILGGGSPYAGEAEIKATKDVLEGTKILLTDPDSAVLRRAKALGRSLTDEERNSLLANDAEALIASTLSLLEWPPLSNHELSQIPVPCLLYCGDVDPRHAGVKESVNHMPRAEFVSLPGLDHVPAFARSELVIPHIKRFLAEASNNIKK